MSAANMEPIETLDRLTDLCIEAKSVLAEADRDDLRTIDQLVELLLFEIALTLVRTSRHEGLNGGGA